MYKIYTYVYINNLLFRDNNWKFFRTRRKKLGHEVRYKEKDGWKRYLERDR